jgi:Fe-S-cluster containining protein
MIKQGGRQQNKGKATEKTTYKISKLAFVGCENCSLNCCNGTVFNQATVLLNDFFGLAKIFPIVFQPTDSGEKIEMKLIFSMKKGVPCLYQNLESKKCTIWGSVRPGACRSYPFIRNIKTTAGSKTHFTIGFDRYCQGVQESAEGIKIFTDDGEISQEIFNNFFGHVPLTSYVENLLATNKFLKLVNELDLLAQEEIVVGKIFTTGRGFHNVKFEVLKISEKKLGALDSDSVLRLQTGGYLKVINEHLKSLTHFRRLHQAMTAFEKSRQSVNMLDFTFGR